MTSNQLAYWKLREEERTNQAKEKETQRHNVAEETLKLQDQDLKRLDQALEARGLDIKDKQLLSNMAELYVNSGATGYDQLPSEMQEKLAEAYGVGALGNRDASFDEIVTGIYKELKDLFKGGGAKIISNLF